MKPILLLTVLLALFSHLANGQVKTNFNNAGIMTSKGKFGKNFLAKSPRTIPAKDIKSLLEKEASEGNLGEAKPFKIAEAVKVDIDVVKEAAWIEEAGFAHGKYTVVANGAKSISANFDRFKLPKGTELYVYSENGEMITGPVTENENNERNFWGTWVYKGGSLTVDFKTPIETKAELKLHISSVAYGYKDIYRSEVNNFGESSPCNINVLCPLGNGWENERNSVSLILNGNSTAFCTGALINNTCNLNIPFLLTANHCFAASTDVANWKFTFQAWSATCNPSQNANGTTFNGSTLRANNAGSDFCLVELNQLPPANSGITFSGWSRNTAGIQNTTIIHHPAGDVMKISRDDQAPVFATFSGSQEWQLVLDQGATNGGSSGAPYYDQNHRIIAQHRGINQVNLPACQQVNKFGGRFDISWTGGGTNATRLSNWLDPNNTNAINTDTRGIGIFGPAFVCNSEIYSFVGPVTWSSSNPLGLFINAANGLATRQNSFDGQVTITATVPSGCGNVAFTRNVIVGRGIPSNQFAIGESVYCNSRTLMYNGFVSPVPGATNYQWFVKTGNNPYVATSINGPTQYSMNWAISRTQTQFFKVIVTTPCGNLEAEDGPYQAIPSDCSDGNRMALSAYPNPATNTLTIELLDSATNNTDIKMSEVYQVYLMDRLSKKVFEGQLQDRKMLLPTETLQPGIYYLNVFYKDQALRKQIIIKK